MADPSPWSRRIDRLREMRRDELFDRLRQYVTARIDAISYRSGNNLAAASESGPAGALGRFYFTPAEVPELIGTLRQILPAQACEIVLQAEKI